MRTRLLLTIVLASLLAGYAGWWVARDFRKAEACERLQEVVASVAISPLVRRATKPTRSSQRKRLEGKASRGQIKAARARVRD